MADKQNWPSWRFGPDGQSRIFQKDDQIPEGWEDHPDKVKEPSKKQKPAPSKPQQPQQQEPTPEERANTIRDIREAAAAQGIDIQLSDDASVEEINAAIDKLAPTKE